MYLPRPQVRCSGSAVQSANTFESFPCILSKSFAKEQRCRTRDSCFYSCEYCSLSPYASERSESDLTSASKPASSSGQSACCWRFLHFHRFPFTFYDANGMGSQQVQTDGSTALPEIQRKSTRVCFLFCHVSFDLNCSICHDIEGVISPSLSQPKRRIFQKRLSTVGKMSYIRKEQCTSTTPLGYVVVSHFDYFLAFCNFYKAHFYRRKSETQRASQDHQPSSSPATLESQWCHRWLDTSRFRVAGKRRRV
jgi:hypothetical protein